MEIKNNYVNDKLSLSSQIQFFKMFFHCFSSLHFFISVSVSVSLSLCLSLSLSLSHPHTHKHTLCFSLEISVSFLLWIQTLSKEHMFDSRWIIVALNFTTLKKIALQKKIYNLKIFFYNNSKNRSNIIHNDIPQIFSNTFLFKFRFQSFE